MPLAPASDGAVLAANVVTLPKEPRAKPRLLTGAVQSGGQARRYVLVVPATLDPARRYPLVLYFHGDGGDGAGMHQGVPFENASGDDALIAYPDGIGHTWDLETPRDNRDVAFVEALIDEVAAAHPVDRPRIFATGYSNGGFFANVLACQRSSLIRAIASNAGGAPYNQADRWPNQFPKCPGEAPVAAIALHGENDNGVTLDSGRFSAEYWAYVNGCNMGAMEATAYPECRAYRGCATGKPVAFCQVPGLGHWVWDRASVVSWQFFTKVSGPPPQSAPAEPPRPAP
jgi:polyhydroxybutyrate depolymerase